MSLAPGSAELIISENVLFLSSIFPAFPTPQTSNPKPRRLLTQLCSSESPAFAALSEPYLSLSFHPYLSLSPPFTVRCVPEGNGEDGMSVIRVKYNQSLLYSLSHSLFLSKSWYVLLSSSHLLWWHVRSGEPFSGEPCKGTCTHTQVG